MTRTQLIEQIYKQHYIENFAKKYISYVQDDFDDFVQFLYMIICELPESKLQELQERNELQYYLYYIARAQATNPRSRFNRAHKGRLETVSYDELLEQEREDEAIPFEY